MTPREAILTAVRENLPPAVSLPDIPATRSTGCPDRKGIKRGLGYKEHFHRLPEVEVGEGESILSYFCKQLEAMGGRSFELLPGLCHSGECGAAAKVAQLFPAAKVVCSAVPEVPGTRRIESVNDPHELNDVDVAVVRSPLAVAETGAVWLTQKELVTTALGVLAQHLIVLLDPVAVLADMHEAYGRIDLAAAPYGVFLAGPSATGDIEGVIIHGAQGARSLSVLFVPPIV